MGDPFLWLSMTVLTAILVLGGIVVSGARRIASLANQTPADAKRLPMLSIVVAARDEAGVIEPALRSLLAQDYPRLEVIAVNDRSGDDTGAILDAMTTAERRLIVQHVRVLPDGWLGKTHALWTGAKVARGEWLLFTDADVVMASTAVSRALGYVTRERLDHLTVMPHVEAQSPLLRILVLQFALSFLGYFRPWQMPQRRDRFAGVGAFNLVRAALYRSVNGHAAIALSPLDDMMLARLVRHGGGRSAALFGETAVRVAWYADAKEMIRGFRKNGFAAFEFRVHRLVSLTGAVAVLGLWPWLGLLTTSGAAWVANAAAVAATLAVHAWFARRSGWPLPTALLAPLGTLATLWMWWRASWLTLRDGEIVWRETRYSLARLRAHHEALRRQ